LSQVERLIAAWSRPDTIFEGSLFFPLFGTPSFFFYRLSVSSSLPRPLSERVENIIPMSTVYFFWLTPMAVTVSLQCPPFSILHFLSPPLLFPLVHTQPPVPYLHFPPYRSFRLLRSLSLTPRLSTVKAILVLLPPQVAFPPFPIA